MAYISWGTNFRGFRGGSDPRIQVQTPRMCSFFVQSTKIGTHENKAIHIKS